MKTVMKDIETYIAQFPAGAQEIMVRLRELIRMYTPGAEELIMYGVPFYRYHGPFAGFAAYQDHVSFGCGADAMTEETSGALRAKGYRVGQATVQIQFGQSVPEAEIAAILKEKARRNERDMHAGTPQ